MIVSAPAELTEKTYMVCFSCGKEWFTRSKLSRVTCASCGARVINPSSEYQKSLKPING
jgi:predicted RNA-binding Zn-ribbon protein involved in translation (DUF1610 family)